MMSQSPAILKLIGDHSPLLWCLPMGTELSAHGPQR